MLDWLFWIYSTVGAFLINIHGYDYVMQLNNDPFFSVQPHHVCFAIELVGTVLLAFSVFVLPSKVAYNFRQNGAAVEGQPRAPCFPHTWFLFLLGSLVVVRYLQWFVLLSIDVNASLQAINLNSQVNDSSTLVEMGFGANRDTLLRIVLSSFGFQQPFSVGSGDSTAVWTLEILYECVGSLVLYTILFLVLASASPRCGRVFGLIPMILLLFPVILSVGGPMMLYHYTQLAQLDNTDFPVNSIVPATLAQWLSLVAIFVAWLQVSVILFPLFTTTRVPSDILDRTDPNISRCKVWRVRSKFFNPVAAVCSTLLFVWALFQYNIMFPDMTFAWSQPSSISSNLNWSNWGHIVPLDLIRLYGIWNLVLLVASVVCSWVACTARESWADIKRAIENAQPPAGYTAIPSPPPPQPRPVPPPPQPVIPVPPPPQPVIPVPPPPQPVLPVPPPPITGTATLNISNGASSVSNSASLNTGTVNMSEAAAASSTIVKKPKKPDCMTCAYRPAEYSFQCGHKIMCEQCARDVEMCLICRSFKEEVIPVLPATPTEH